MNLKNKLFGVFEYCIGLKNADGNVDFLMPSFRYWYADPMLREINGRYYLFAEQFDKTENKGMISVSEIVNGKIEKPTTIINENYHMSFPDVFEYNGEFFMIPETVGAGKIIIYKMIEDVYHWEIVNSFDITDCVDTVVYVDNDCIYLLTCEEHPTNKLYDRLRLLKINNPYDKDIKECTDTAISDKEYSLHIRNGGNFFEKSGKLYRIAQNSTEDYYGKSISIYHTEEINFSEYSESFVEEKNIDDFPKPGRFATEGVHTYGMDKEFTVWDYSGRTYRIENFFTKLKQKFSKISTV